MKILFICVYFVSLAINGISQDTGTFTDIRDGKTYKWVKIGKQIWMAENLAFNKGNGCYPFENNPYNLSKYGYLYDWEAAQEACPSGWHLPSKADFESLLNNPGRNRHDAFNSLTERGKSGFLALFAGSRRYHGNFEYLGKNAYFWSATKNGSDEAWHLYIIGYRKEVIIYSSETVCGFSVRCLKH